MQRNQILEQSNGDDEETIRLRERCNQYKTRQIIVAFARFDCKCMERYIDPLHEYAMECKECPYRRKFLV